MVIPIYRNNESSKYLCRLTKVASFIMSIKICNKFPSVNIVKRTITVCGERVTCIHVYNAKWLNMK